MKLINASSEYLEIPILKIFANIITMNCSQENKTQFHKYQAMYFLWKIYSKTLFGNIMTCWKVKWRGWQSYGFC